MNIPKINTENIKTTVRSLPSNTLKGVNSVGEASINCANTVSTFIKGITPEKVKNIKTSAFASKISGFAKQAADKMPDFVKNAAKNSSEFVKQNKKTFAGGAVIAAAVACAVAIIKTVAGKIKEAKAAAK